MGTSDISQPFTASDECTVAKCEKPNNDGLVDGCTVAKGVSGQEASHLAEPGLSLRSIQELRDAYQDRACAHAQENDGDTRTADCDAWLRQTLAERGVLPEAVEVEFKRVMDLVFAV